MTDFCNNAWLGIVDLFQTFEELESVKDKQADIQTVRELLDTDGLSKDKGIETYIA